MEHTTTWKPWAGDANGKLPGFVFAFPEKRLDPLIDAVSVRTALEHFHMIPEVSDQERTEAFDNIKKAAIFFHMEVSGETYEEMLRRPQVEVIPRD